MSHITKLTKELRKIRDWYHEESKPWGILDDAALTIEFLEMNLKEARTNIDVLKTILKEHS